ncbi:receptor-like protein EIX2 isoform X5 [Prosopis cineraria]|uniref:receptor-like protein EIX2 isoform X5 n=1 Tax=Prosopis cineraria TaxID=364024 RepID=UPI00240EC2B1|nr:receptor-like protein EIX2 isoform X5 [Prosopis cineraria]
MSEISVSGVQCDNTTGRVIQLSLPCPLEPFADDCGETRSHCLTGEIPQDMAELSFLEVLNLSFNSFTGKIPTGTQFQGFDSQSFMGDPRLCGAPLPKNCSDKEDHAEPVETSDGQEDEFLSCFYIGIGVGFATAFWGVCIAIFFNKNFRHSYFRFLYRMQDKLEMVVLEMNRFH